ncbi:hypothetical protein ACJMK2_000072 [Sinanodonta woodiana]|uniref:Uncharacterized protein n=1 Tax=Sinanodonta woodiana TaxID=1069815 RepID=A0ABD3XRL4_SINWO
MDDNSIQLYQKALDAGKEKVYNIRVMVVGQFGVGKTTLIKRLLGQPVDIAERKSTEGIDVHKHCCKLSLDKGEWIEPVDSKPSLSTACIKKNNVMILTVRNCMGNVVYYCSSMKMTILNMRL